MRTLLTMFAACVFSGMALADEVSVTPYRPTVTNSAALSAPGWLELESGLSGRHDADTSRQGQVPYLFKLATSRDFGVLVGGDAYMVQSNPDGSRISGGGDTTVLLKHRFSLSAYPDTALGLEYGVKTPTAKNGLGSGKRDIVLNGIVSTELSGHQLDINLNTTQLGGVPPSESNQQWGWSGTVFRMLDEKWGAMGELSGVARRGLQANNHVLLAVSYQWSSRLVIDAGMTAGISSSARDKALFAGMSVLLGKLY